MLNARHHRPAAVLASAVVLLLVAAPPAVAEDDDPAGPTDEVFLSVRAAPDTAVGDHLQLLFDGADRLGELCVPVGFEALGGLAGPIEHHFACTLAEAGDYTPTFVDVPDGFETAPFVCVDVHFLDPAIEPFVRPMLEGLTYRCSATLDRPSASWSLEVDNDDGRIASQVDMTGIPGDVPPDGTCIPDDRAGDSRQSVWCTFSADGTYQPIVSAPTGYRDYGTSCASTDLGSDGDAVVIDADRRWWECFTRLAAPLSIIARASTSDDVAALVPAIFDPADVDVTASCIELPEFVDPFVDEAPPTRLWHCLDLDNATYRSEISGVADEADVTMFCEPTTDDTPGFCLIEAFRPVEAIPPSTAPPPTTIPPLALVLPETGPDDSTGTAGLVAALLVISGLALTVAARRTPRSTD